MRNILTLLRKASPNARVALQGQSNTVGLAYRTDLVAEPLVSSDPGLAALDGVPIPRVYIFKRNFAQYVPLQIGLSNMGGDLTRFGPEFGLAVRWLRETSTGNLYIDKYAEGGQSIDYFSEGTTFFSGSLVDKSAADAWLLANGVTAPHMGWLWVQGEFDYLWTEAEYRVKLDALVAARLAAGLQPADGKLLIVQMRPGTSRYGAGVAAAKTAFVAADPQATLIEMSAYFNVDNLHLSARGQVQLGYDAFQHFFGQPAVAA